VGNVQDQSDSNWMTGSRIVTGAQPVAVGSISVYVGVTDSAPRNQFSTAIYSDSGGAPNALVAQSATGSLNANAWNTLPITAVLSPNTAYWLMYNANGSNQTLDNLFYNNDPSNVGAWQQRAFGSWPASFGSATVAPQRYSIYATASGSGATLTPTATPTPTPTPSVTPTSTPTPTGTLSTLGVTTVGSVQDVSDSNWMTGSRIVTGSQIASVVSMSVYVGAVGSAPTDQFSVAIYTDAGGSPSALVAHSATGTLIPNSWNTLSIAATLSPNTAYWLMYNANGSNQTSDNMFYDPDSSNVGAWASRAFGSWPDPFGAATLAGQRYSMYVTLR
jgi:hypothetical protein